MKEHSKWQALRWEILLPGIPGAVWRQPVWVGLLCTAGQYACFVAGGVVLLAGLIPGHWATGYLCKAGTGMALLLLLRLSIRGSLCPFCHRFTQWEPMCGSIRCQYGRPAGKTHLILRCRRCGCICKAKMPLCRLFLAA